MPSTQAALNFGLNKKEIAQPAEIQFPI